MAGANYTVALLILARNSSLHRPILLVWHSLGVGTRNRFLVVVLSAYKQMKSQRDNVLSDIDEDNFDRAFKSFRPGKTFR